MGLRWRRDLRVAGALQRIDTPGVLFFFGVLMSVAALDQAGLLVQLATSLDASIPSREALAGCIGLLSAVVDNVPLVAASQGMYSLAEYPADDQLWQLVAYCAGTGGSLLVIGSAAGVAYMGLVEGVSFGWYLRQVTPWALLGYAGGFGVYLLQSALIVGYSM
jgi:Na+/H+ antiporter NhaD/arsenite permease-like protein